MKRHELPILLDNITYCQAIKSLAIQMKLLDNMQLIRAEMSKFKEALERDGRYHEYKRNMEHLRISHAKEDKDGNTVQIVSGGQLTYQIANMQKFTVEKLALEKQYQEAIDDYKAAMNEEISLPFKLIPRNILPKDQDGSILGIAELIESPSADPKKKTKKK